MEAQSRPLLADGDTAGGVDAWEVVSGAFAPEWAANTRSSPPTWTARPTRTTRVRSGGPQELLLGVEGCVSAVTQTLFALPRTRPPAASGGGPNPRFAYPIVAPERRPCARPPTRRPAGEPAHDPHAGPRRDAAIRSVLRPRRPSPLPTQPRAKQATNDPAFSGSARCA